MYVVAECFQYFLIDVICALSPECFMFASICLTTRLVPIFFVLNDMRTTPIHSLRYLPTIRMV